MPSSNGFNELRQPVALRLNDRTLYVYPVSFDFALLTFTVITTLRNSIREGI